MGRGGYFNSSGRRSGGYRRAAITVIPPVDPERARLLQILRDQIAAAGLAGADLQEVYERLEATSTDVLRDCVENASVAEAERLATGLPE